MIAIAVVLCMSCILFQPTYVYAVSPPIAVSVELNSFNDTIVGGDDADTLLWIKGDAVTTSGKLRLVTAASGGAGTVVRRNQIQLTEGFSTYFQLQMHNSVNGGADGMAFIVYKNDTPQIGAYGGGLGYSGISNSIAVEFDTWLNDDMGDGSNAQVAIMLNGDSTHVNQPEGSLINYPAIEGSVINAWVDYDGTTITTTFGTGSTRTDEANRTISRNVGTLLSGENVFVGFAASTGWARDDHDLLKWYFKDGYVEGGLNPAAESYTQAAATIGITLNQSTNPTNAVIFAYDETGNEMDNQDIEVFLDGVSKGTYNTGTEGYAYSIPKGLSIGTYSLRAVAAGGASNFEEFMLTEESPIVTDVTEPKQDANPETGESGEVYVVFLLVGLLGIMATSCSVIVQRRQKNH